MKNKSQENEPVWNETDKDNWRLVSNGIEVGTITLKDGNWRTDLSGNITLYPIGSWGGKEPTLSMAKRMIQKEWNDQKEDEEFQECLTEEILSSVEDDEQLYIWTKKSAPPEKDSGGGEC